MKLINIATAVALAVGLAAPARAEVLRFSSFEPPVAHITKNILTAWAADVSAASDGELEVQMFPGGTLGRNPAQQLKLVEDGVADIAWVIPGYTPGRFNEGTVAELPFLVKTSTAGSAAMWALFDSGLLKGDYESFKLIGVMSSSPNGLASTVDMTEPGELKGQNIRAPGPTMLSAIKSLDAVPVGGITGPTLAESLSRGLIDGTFTQWGALETFSAGGVVTHFLELPLGATPMLIVMNKAKYEGLSDKAKAAIDAYSGAAFSDRFGRSFDEYLSEAKGRILAANKITVIDPDEALTAKWQDAMSVATQDWIAQTENGQAIYDAFKAELEKAEASN
ncbi:C4-dicarboxylate ABC transporter substrate-binding protein [Pseudooceanicola sp. 216_PA32_1]|uniref:C4-dicarboxylate ABC transporter substrate-binding protein n=1 Tax=Pseudooceanicola pacificus TaxID=2676438 RepID=A0A844WEJ3_9RHOB|nr:TRAP transporter substrate-binding protein [Pseudooceanicola pacificus]MWB79102.1 C4-dicarboxylate ABC transporter substrate-binding protein [Pseudooceanicola pacificus]